MSRPQEIRGFGTGPPVLVVPTLDVWGLAALAALLGLFALRRTRRSA